MNYFISFVTLSRMPTIASVSRPQYFNMASASFSFSFCGVAGEVNIGQLADAVPPS